MRGAHVTRVGVAVAVGMTAVTGSVSAHTVYLDPFGPGGDVDPFFLSQGFGHLDLVSVEAFNTGLQSLHMRAFVDGDIAATNWGKFNVYFDTRPGGRTDSPWGRNIVAGGDADWFIGGWADGGGGAELYQATPGGWTLVSATYNPGSLLSVDLANASFGVWGVEVQWGPMGLAVGQRIGLEVATTAGGATDPGVDHLSLGTIATPNWATGSIGGPLLEYVVEPAPGSAAVMGLAWMMAPRRRR